MALQKKGDGNTHLLVGSTDVCGHNRNVETGKFPGCRGKCMGVGNYPSFLHPPCSFKLSPVAALIFVRIWFDPWSALRIRRVQNSYQLTQSWEREDSDSALFSCKLRIYPIYVFINTLFLLLLLKHIHPWCNITEVNHLIPHPGWIWSILFNLCYDMVCKFQAWMVSKHIVYMKSLFVLELVQNISIFLYHLLFVILVHVSDSWVVYQGGLSVLWG